MTSCPHYTHQSRHYCMVHWPDRCLIAKFSPAFQFLAVLSALLLMYSSGSQAVVLAAPVVQGPDPFALFALGQPDIRRVPTVTAPDAVTRVQPQQGQDQTQNHARTAETSKIDSPSMRVPSSTTTTTMAVSSTISSTPTHSTSSSSISSSTWSSLPTFSSSNSTSSPTAAPTTTPPPFRGGAGLDPSRPRATLPPPTYTPPVLPPSTDLDRQVLIRYREAGLSEEQVRALENSDGPPARIVDEWRPIATVWVWAGGVGGAVGVVGVVGAATVLVRRRRR